MIKIGIAAGLDALTAAHFKKVLLATGERKGVALEVIEDTQKPREDAPTARLALGDFKIAAFLSARALKKAGAQVGVLADLRAVPCLREVQAEVTLPLVTLFSPKTMRGVKKAALFGSAGLADGWACPSPEVEIIEPEASVREELAGLEAKVCDTLCESVKARLLEIGRELVARGAEVLVPTGRLTLIFAEELSRAGLPVYDGAAAAAEAALAGVAEPKKPFKIGMIGGLGPAATVDLYDKIVKATPAKTDQEHVKLVVEQNPQIPDRTAALLHGGVDPTLALFNCAIRLQEDDCDVVIVPCNTAHAFIPYMERHLKIPFVNMQQAALDEIKAKLGEKARIGLMATSGTVQTGIYGDKAKAMNLPLFVPDAERQERVMAAIYGPKGAKAGYTDGICREDLLSAAEYLVKTYDCNCLILGCTELPLILDESDAFEVAGRRVVVVDPTSALARKVVALAASRQ